jgi:NAD(P)-dependent dehydrogenase (short-subunit alcohol dehydrogenase family)
MSQFNLDYSGKTVIVTGAAGGLGLALAQAFYANNANVVITDVNDARLASAPEQFAAEDRESRFLAVNADSSDEAQVEELIKKTVEKFGSLDVLVNNAAVNDDLEPTGDVERKMWDLNIKVNLTAPYVTSKAAINEFLKKDGPQKGVILNVISAAGMHGFRAGTTRPETRSPYLRLIYSRCRIYRLQAWSHWSHSKYGGILRPKGHSLRGNFTRSHANKHGRGAP